LRQREKKIDTAPRRNPNNIDAPDNEAATYITALPSSE
jgi:hypothetical protein